MNVNFAQLRQKMVDNQIRTVDVTNLPVLAAFLEVPREVFVPQDEQALAYLDKNMQTSAAKEHMSARYMMAPAALARLVQLAEIEKEDFVLDIGANTGYCAAILSQLAGSVIALESDERLAKTAAGQLAANGYDNAVVVVGALKAGYGAQAPYDVIVFEGAVDFVPADIFGQLREGGRLVVVEGGGNAAEACLYVREDGVISRRCAFNLSIKPLPGFQKAEEFIF